LYKRCPPSSNILSSPSNLTNLLYSIK
jgi:hypothetical protein